MDSSLTIHAIMPGALLFKAAAPAGVPLVDTPRSRLVWGLMDSAAFSVLPDDEKEAVVTSLVKSVERAEYHFQRFSELRSELDKRRLLLPGEVFWDTLTTCVHFELQAFCGAARLLVDELLYLTARRHGVPPRDAVKHPWEAHQIFSGSPPVSLAAMAEVRRMSGYKDWFQTLNTYRNAFFHHGWRHGSGHGDLHQPTSLSSAPGRNALFGPDQDSIKSKSEPCDWTWVKGTTIDDVSSTVRNGLLRILDELCTDEWGVDAPKSGRVPISEQPNIIVTLVKPVAVLAGRRMIFPMFSDVSAAKAFEPFCSQKSLELVYVPASEAVVGRRAITFSLAGLDEVAREQPFDAIVVFIDPSVAALTSATAQSTVSMPLADLLKNASVQPFSIPVEPHVKELFVWRERQEHEWGRV